MIESITARSPKRRPHTIPVYQLGYRRLLHHFSWADNSHRSERTAAPVDWVVTGILGPFAVYAVQVCRRGARQETETVRLSHLKRLMSATLIAGAFWAVVGTVAAHDNYSTDQWPTTCVDLNDIVEGHLGNKGNVAIYQNTFGDQAEAACQNDHRSDVRSVFEWAIGGDAPPAAVVVELTVTTAEVPADLPSYDRDQWGRWSDADGDCQDTRQEVLISESIVPVTYKTARQCRVASGEWFGAFTGSTVAEPGALDIDHLVPLANAHGSGAWAWPEERKRAYYNSLDDADHLIRSRPAQTGPRAPEDRKNGDRPTNRTGANTLSTGSGSSKRGV